MQPINNYILQICIDKSIYDDNVYKLTEIKNMIRINYHIVENNSSTVEQESIEESREKKIKELSQTSKIKLKNRSV